MTITKYTRLGYTEDKYVDFNKIIAETGLNDRITVKYLNIVSVCGLITEKIISTNGNKIEFIFNGTDECNEGMYTGTFRVTISTEGVDTGTLATITIAIKVVEKELWEKVRVIPVVAEQSFSVYDRD